MRSSCLVLVLSVTALAGCETQPAGTASEPASTGDIVWAINVGGPAYKAVDGTPYSAEESVTGGQVESMPKVLGSQDDFLYLDYRKGDIRIARPIANDTYDVTFHFAEPGNAEPGDRVFDAFIENRRVIDGLDVMLWRDAKIESALTVTVPDIEVTDGELTIGFEAEVNEPVLSALVVRNRNRHAGPWKLVWSDEFDYEGAPDPDKWTIDEWPARKVNDEDQAYTAREKNLRVEDGFLIIEAHKEKYDNAGFTSGRLHSSGKGDFLYGRIEARAKVPSGTGTWAAIWMLPSDPFRYATTCKAGDVWQGSPTCDAWPKSGEIDILEHVGYQMNHVHGTVHNEAYYWINWQQRKGRILLDSVDQNFYTYALEWTPDDIRIFVDDTLYFIYANENEGWEAWPYDHAFHVVMNLAIGGYWGRAGGGIDDDMFPRRMLVDYVRVYKKSAN